MKLSLYFSFVLVFLLKICEVNAADWQQDIELLREDIRVLQRQVYRGIDSEEKMVSSANSEIQGKIGEYDETVRKLNGRVDELEFKLKQVDEKIEKLNRDIDIRFKILEGRQVPDSLVSPVVSLPVTYSAPVAENASRVVVGDSIQGSDLAPIAGTKVVPDKNIEINEESSETNFDNDGPQQLIPNDLAVNETKVEVVSNRKKLNADEMYAAGMEALNSGFYDEAELAFEHILKDFPKDKLAGNAQFWLGEAYYKQGEFNKAKHAFKNGYEKYRSGNKAADSLFKLGMTLKSMNENKNACIVFMSFSAEFPKANADLNKRVKTEAKKLGCK